MYPKIYIDSFRTFERTDDLFVAMPFAEQFNERWVDLFCPVANIVGLKPYRVDVRIVSDSILTDILAAIATSRLLLYDVSFVSYDGGAPAPNPNVMYELGLAQAIRLPEEVIVIRDLQSGDPTPFDIAHIRYHSISLEDTDKSIEFLSSLLSSSLDQIDHIRDKLVHKASKCLDIDDSYFLGTIGTMETFDLYPFDPDRKGLYGLPHRDSSETELRHIARRLIGLGLLQPADPGPIEGRVYGAMSEYLVTDLGRAVYSILPAWAKPIT